MYRERVMKSREKVRHRRNSKNEKMFGVIDLL